MNNTQAFINMLALDFLKNPNGHGLTVINHIDQTVPGDFQQNVFNFAAALSNMSGRELVHRSAAELFTAVTQRSPMIQSTLFSDESKLYCVDSNLEAEFVKASLRDSFKQCVHKQLPPNNPLTEELSRCGSMILVTRSHEHPHTTLLQSTRWIRFSSKNWIDSYTDRMILRRVNNKEIDFPVKIDFKNDLFEAPCLIHKELIDQLSKKTLR